MDEENKTNQEPKSDKPSSGQSDTKKSSKTDKKKQNKTLGGKFNEIKAEFKKIIWTPKDEVVKQTVTVIVVSIIFGLIIFGMDTALNFSYNTAFDTFGPKIDTPISPDVPDDLADGVDVQAVPGEPTTDGEEPTTDGEAPVANPEVPTTDETPAE